MLFTAQIHSYFRNDRSTADVISLAPQSTLDHLVNKNTHAWLLFINCSSAFTTIISSKLVSKFQDLGLCTFLCNWIIDFIMGRPQSVWISKNISSLTTNTSAPKGWVFSPLLCSLHTSDCVAERSSNAIDKFTDDPIVVGGDESSMLLGHNHPHH